MQDRRKLFFKMSHYLKNKSGPIRAERLPEHLGMGVAYFDLSTADKRIIVGALARCGFEQRDWPFWFRKSDDDATEEKHPSWIARKAAA
jgi:hypothetical protein